MPSFTNIRLLSGYFFWGAIIIICSLSSIENSSTSNFTDLFIVITLFGSIVGSLLASLRVHKLFRYVYFHLWNTLENDYKSFDKYRITYYLQSLYVTGLLIFGILSHLKIETLEESLSLLWGSLLVNSSDLNFISIIFWITVLISCFYWIITYYSNREKLVLIRHVQSTSLDNLGMREASQDIVYLHEFIEKGQWDHAAAQFEHLIYVCETNSKVLKVSSLKILTKNGFIFFDYDKREEIKRILITSRFLLKEKEQRRITEVQEKQLERLTKRFLKLVEILPVFTYEYFIEQNLHWYLKIDKLFKNKYLD